MKKWLVILLLLIVAAGTFVPCCGINDCCADQLADINHNSHENEGTCSPFFACATCTASVVVTKTIQMDFPKIEKPVHHPATVMFDLPVYSSAFWQPPRFC